MRKTAFSSCGDDALVSAIAELVTSNVETTLAGSWLRKGTHAMALTSDSGLLEHP